MDLQKPLHPNAKVGSQTDATRHSHTHVEIWSMCMPEAVSRCKMRNHACTRMRSSVTRKLRKRKGVFVRRDPVESPSSIHWCLLIHFLRNRVLPRVTNRPFDRNGRQTETRDFNSLSSIHTQYVRVCVRTHTHTIEHVSTHLRRKPRLSALDTDKQVKV